MSTQPDPNMQWQPTNPPPPAAPVQQKSWFARHKILTALLAVLLLGAVGKTMGGGSDTTNETAATGSATSATVGPGATKQPAVTKAPGIGVKVRDGKFEFAVTKVENIGREIGSSVLSEKAQGSFWLVHVTVSNIGDEPQTLLDSEQKVTDATGRTFSPSSSAAILLEDNDVLVNEINPGNTVRGRLVYDMPTGAVPAKIQLHDSLLSDGVVVSLR